MTKRITSSEVYAAFDLLCTALDVANETTISHAPGDYLMIDNESPNGTNADRRYYVTGSIAGSSVEFGFFGASNAYETIKLMTRAALWAKR